MCFLVREIGQAPRRRQQAPPAFPDARRNALQAATPFSGSLEVRRRFPSASLIATVGGTSHANTLAGNASVDYQIAAYLAEGTVPRRLPGPGPDVNCDPLPEPEPVPAPARAAAASGGGDIAQLAALRVHSIAAGD
jgi:hypothetical protein